MDALTLLKEDHERTMELMDQIESLCDDDSQARKIFGQLKQALGLHSELEEKVFYPAISQFEETRDLVEESYRRHQEIDDLAADISRMSPHDEEFLDQVSELREMIENHVSEEEDELFPEVEELLGKGRLEELGRKIEQLAHRQAAAANKRK